MQSKVGKPPVGIAAVSADPWGVRDVVRGWGQLQTPLGAAGKGKGRFLMLYSSEPWSWRPITAANEMPSCRRIWELTASMVRHRRESRLNAIALLWLLRIFPNCLAPSRSHPYACCLLLRLATHDVPFSKKTAVFCTDFTLYVAFKATQKWSAFYK